MDSFILENIIANRDYINFEKDDEQIIYLIDRFKYIDILQQIEEIEYVDILRLYREIIFETQKYLKENLNSDNIVWCGAISELLWEGLISKNKKFVYSSNLPFELCGSHEGLNVILGEGCCRNLVGVSKLLLEANVDKVYNLGSHLRNEHTSLLHTMVDRYDIDGNKLNYSIFDLVKYENDRKQNSNHLVNFFEYNGENGICFDPTNVKLFITNSLDAKEICGKTKALLHPYTLLKEKYDHNDMVNFIQNLQNFKVIRNNYKYFELFQSGVKKIYNSKDKDDFYNSIKAKIDEVHELVLRKM